MVLSAAPTEPSRLRLWLCIALPMALAWWLPRSYGASIEAFPLMIGLLAAGLAATVGLGGVKRGALLWVAGVMLLVLLRRSPLPLYTLMIVPVALAAWVGLALGASAWRDERIAHAVVGGLVLGLALNFVSAWLQFFRWEPHLYPWFTLNGSNRIYGNLRQANHLATLFVAGLALLWGAAARRALTDGKIIVLVVCACLVIAMTGSRTGLLEVIGVAAFALCWRRSVSPRVAAVFIGTPLLVIVCSLGASSWAQHLEGERVSVTDRTDGYTGSMRLLHWTAALDLIRAEPFLGVGWREFRHARFELRPQDSTIEVVENAHNTPLHLAVELGIPAALLIIVPVGLFVARHKPWRAVEPRQQAAWLVLCALLLHSMLEHPLWYMNFLFLGAMAAGLVMAKDEGRNDLVPMPKVLGWVQIVLLLAAMVDYDKVSAPYGRTLFNWGDTLALRLEAAQKSVLFGLYADRALLTQVVVTPENHESAAHLADRLMHYAPDPPMLNVRLLAYCAGNDMSTVAATLRPYRLAYPAHFANFRASLSPEIVERCRL